MQNKMLFDFNLHDVINGVSTRYQIMNHCRMSAHTILQQIDTNMFCDIRSMQWSSKFKLKKVCKCNM